MLKIKMNNFGDMVDDGVVLMHGYDAEGNKTPIYLIVVIGLNLEKFGAMEKK